MQSPLDTTTDIETPELVRFQHRLAGPAQRSLAYLIDATLRLGIVAALATFTGLASQVAQEDIAGGAAGLMLVGIFVVEWGYYVACETLMNGQSPGKALLRLRVTTDSGQPLTIVDSILRNLLRAADFLPSGYALGLVVMTRDRRFRRLGDLVAGTMVVVEQAHAVSAPLRIDPPPTAGELRALPDRIPLSADELDAVELFLRRARHLAPARRDELAAMVTPVWARRIGLQPRDPERFLALLHHRARGPRS
jgi:uncharacterized RDD family membrane protein YckC